MYVQCIIYIGDSVSIGIMGGMEEDKPAAAAVSTNSRWNPTKEQIGMLESLYKQGIRTPTADQIQEIAGKLREHGSIEGKNVFYWFQNHKARQRQKQKQETVACFNRLLRKASKIVPSPSPSPSPVHLPPHRRRRHHRPLAHPPPPPPPPLRCTANAVLCSPYFFPRPPPGIGYYPHYPPMLLPGTALPNLSNDANQFQKSYFSPHCSYKPNYQTVFNTHETLQLFPLHPTGPSALEVTTPPNSVHSTTTTSACSYSKEEEDEEEESGNEDVDDGDGDHLVLNLECR